MKYLKSYKVFEDTNSNINFVKQPKLNPDAKTDTYKVLKNGIAIGQIKWYSRMRGYAFLPSEDCNNKVKDFIANLMQKYRAEKKKNKLK